MDKKYIFFDLDGTLIDHSENWVSDKTLEALKLLKANGHDLFIATGRPPSLFYGIDKELGIDSFIAANGSIAVYKNEVIRDMPIDKDCVNQIVDFAYKNKIDIGFESFDDYVVNSRFGENVDKFSDTYHLHYPEIRHNYHLENNIYQMVLFYTGNDYKKFEKLFPGLRFNYSNAYGLDINQKGGLKELGVNAIKEHLNIDIKDIICVGDGFNDVSMIQYSGLGIAMGNAKDGVKIHADMIADDISNDGLYKVLKELKLI